MKKIKLNASRLQLSKEKVASLSKQDLYKLRGGTGDDTDSCYDCQTLNIGGGCYTFQNNCTNDLDCSETCYTDTCDAYCASQGECDTLNCTPLCNTGPTVCTGNTVC